MEEKHSEDQDYYIKDRINSWMLDKDIALYGSYDGEVEDDDIRDLLLKFYHFLEECEDIRRRE